MLSTTVRLFVVLARLVGLAGVALAVTDVVVSIARAISFISHYGGPTEGVGLAPLMFIVQVGIAAWVAWSVLKHDAPRLLTVLPVAFLGSFVGGFGWYLLLAGEGGETMAVGNLLYLAAALLAACARLASAVGGRLDRRQA